MPTRRQRPRVALPPGTVPAVVVGLALVFFATALPAAATPRTPFLVRDINPSDSNALPAPPLETATVVLGGVAYFSGYDGVTGLELWRTDGTAAGTSLVRDVCPGVCSSGVGSLRVALGRLFFTADDGVHGTELWTSDGTTEGTRLVVDLQPGLTSSYPEQLTAVAGSLFFVARSAGTLRRLYATDGTTAGTRALDPGPSSARPVVLGEGAAGLFYAADDGVHGTELWVSDGTPAGSRLVSDIHPGPDSGVDPYYPDVLWALAASLPGGDLLFLADDGVHGNELWRSDGTAAGTSLVADIWPGAGGWLPRWFTSLSGRVLFTASDGQYGEELWASDGTEEGTAVLRDIYPGDSGSQPTALLRAGDRVFFSALDDVHDRELWVTDGSPGGTHLVRDVQPPVPFYFELYNGWALTAVGDDVLLVADGGTDGLEPWWSDGTEEGTYLLDDVNPGPEGSFPTYTLFSPLFLHDRSAALDGVALFRAYDPVHGIELWRSDGSPAGTGLVADLDAETSSFGLGPSTPYFFDPDRLTTDLGVAGGRVVFQATDGATGLEPWTSDGSTAGTVPLVDIYSGSQSSDVHEFVGVDGGAFFSAYAADNGDSLWHTDGTPGGTERVLTSSGANPGYSARLTAVGGRLFFSAGRFGPTLWVTDGTRAGTMELEAASPDNLAALGDALLLFAAGADHELWRSDGSLAGTYQVADVNPTGGSYPADPVALGSTLYFSADDGVHGRELWASDGTFAGTRLVADLVPGAAGSDPQGLVASGGNVLFSADDGAHGREPWVSDGSPEGTRLLADALPGATSSEPDQLTAVGGRGYFVADDGVHGREVWVSNGTPEGTRLLTDLLPGPESSVPQELAAVDGRLFWTAYTPDLGREAWVDDGAGRGPALVADLAPGPASSSPMSFTFAGGFIYFVADDNVTGYELWALPANTIFTDGFESGDLAAWSDAAP